MKDTVRYAFYISVLFACILLCGTLGYLFLEDNWALSEAFYMTVITMTTVGFGEVRELSQQGQYFTIVIIFMGLCAVAITSALIAKLVVETGIRDVMGGRNMNKRIAKMKSHYIVCGYGRIGSSICHELEEMGLSFVVIEAGDETCAKAEKRGYCVIKGNATQDELLKEAGVTRALGLAAALADDADNLFISLAARELNKKILVISRCEEPGVERRILRAGADMVVSPLKLGGKHIAHLISRNNREPAPEPLNQKMPSILGFSLRLFRHQADQEITVAHAVEAAEALQAVALKREDGTTEMQPNPELKISQQDALLILVSDSHATPEMLEQDTVKAESPAV